MVLTIFCLSGQDNQREKEGKHKICGKLQF